MGRTLPIAVLITLGLFSLTGCEGKRGRRRGGRPGGDTLSVAVEKVRAEPMRESLLGHAALEAEALVGIPTRIDGQVLALKGEAGDQVEAGQVLATLDDTRAKLRVREAQVTLAQSKTSLARQEKLSKQGLAKAEDLEQAKESVQQAELALKRAQLDLDDTKLVSPFAGVITERLIQRGDRLKAGTLAYRIADRDPLLAKVRVPESQAERVKVGQRALVLIEGGAGPIEGKVIRVAPLVDLGSGTVIATVAVSKGTAGIRLNRFATVEIVVEERPQALTIPQAALALRGEEDRVLVCENIQETKKGRFGVARQKTIKVGVRNAGRVEVLGGLAEGDLIVTAAPDDLRDGTRVRVVVRDGARKTQVAAVRSQ